MFKKNLIVFLGMLVSILFSASPVFAHAVVKPSTAGVGSFTDFSLGVPSEKPIATTSVKLMMPAGLNNVSPIVKPGWKIDVKQAPDPSGKKDDDGNPAMIVSEIDWTAGQIPAAQKDLFMFSAQVPAQPAELDWKIEQTYADGSIVSWTLGPNDPEKDGFGPYSKIMVVNDLASSPSPVVSQSSSQSIPLLLSGLAVILSGIALGMQLRKK